MSGTSPRTVLIDMPTANAKRETVCDVIKNLCSSLSSIATQSPNRTRKFSLPMHRRDCVGFRQEPVLIVFPSANAERETVWDVIRKALYVMSGFSYITIFKGSVSTHRRRWLRLQRDQHCDTVLRPTWKSTRRNFNTVTPKGPFRGNVAPAKAHWKRSQRNPQLFDATQTSARIHTPMCRPVARHAPRDW